MKKIIFPLFLISLISLSLGHYFQDGYGNNICYSNFETNTFDISCHSFYENIGNQLFYGMSALSLVFFILLFIPQAFNAWKKFAIWFVPLATFIFIFYPEPGSGDLFSPYPEQVYRWVSTLYVILSFVIIFRNRKIS